jgi:hypothetical protein
MSLALVGVHLQQARAVAHLIKRAKIAEGFGFHCPICVKPGNYLSQFLPPMIRNHSGD